MNVQEIVLVAGGDGTYLAKDLDKWRAVVNTAVIFRVLYAWNFLSTLGALNL